MKMLTFKTAVSSFRTPIALLILTAFLLLHTHSSASAGNAKSFGNLRPGAMSVETILLDTDADGIYDDGDFSGVIGDNPCTGGETANCDDNCVTVYNPSQADSDSDGIGNACEDNAIDFGRASGSRIEVENVGLPDVANTEFTVEAWVKGRAANIDGGIFSYLTPSSNLIEMRVRDNKPQFGTTTSLPEFPTSTPSVVEGSGSILSDVWYHIVGMLVNAVHSHPESGSCSSAVMAETPHLDLYMNGEFNNCASTGGSFINPYSGTEKLYIGKSWEWESRWSSQANFTTEAVIDEVRFWRVARTEQEIRECMNHELGMVPACPINSSILKGYWRLDEGLGTVATDSSGNGYSGDIMLGDRTPVPWSGGWTAGYPFSGINTDTDGDGYTPLTGDCNDSDGLVHPGALEVCDGKDNDCDFDTEDGGSEAWLGSACDGDDLGICAEGINQCIGGVQACSDATGDDIETCDNIDNDCDGITDDGLINPTTCGIGTCSGNAGTEVCVSGAWVVSEICDPYAGASYEVCDNIDNDCDSITDEDLINETTCGVGACFGNTGAITCTAGSWVNNTCDPYAGASPEVPGNGIDDDCNPLTYDTPPDVDGDGDGYTDIQGDCDDTNAAVHPGAVEIPNNRIDDDCNPLTYDSDPNIDDDGDGYVETPGGASAGYSSALSTDVDCDDTNAAVSPGASEILNNGIDDDCDPSTLDSDPDTDDDGDGYSENNGDCDDINPSVNPNASEIRYNGRDDDCDPATHDSYIEALALVTWYYNSILSRAPEQGGTEGWTGEIERIDTLGIDIKEGFIALGKLFFNSTEYLNMSTTNNAYVIDLYETFLGRTPTQGEADYWTGELTGGLTRNLLLNYFIFSVEFKTYMDGIFGNTAVRPEYNLVNDLYRGFLSRLPDDGGYNYWLGQMQTAQCNGDPQAIRDLTSQIALLFLNSQEYADRNTSNSVYIEDLYNGILRRGAELAGYQYWLGVLNGGVYTRAQMLQLFVDSVEFQGRVTEVINAGCAY